MLEKHKLSECVNHRFFRSGVVVSRLIVMTLSKFLFVFMTGINLADAATCEQPDVQIEKVCPDIPKDTKNGQVYSSVFATRIIKGESDLADIDKSMCTLRKRLEKTKTRLSDIYYRPFIMEMSGINGRTWSLHVGCFKDKEKSLKVLQDVLERNSSLQGQQKPYLFPMSLPHYLASKTYKIPPGRGTSLSLGKETHFISQMHIYQDITLKSRIVSEADLQAFIGKRLGIDSSVIDYNKVDYLKGRLNLSYIVSFEKSTKVSFLNMHDIAADITQKYRRSGRTCSQAVVLRSSKDGLLGMRLCEFNEGIKDCRCSVLWG